MSRENDENGLVKEAYELGFDVGYFGHYETVGWIRRENERIQKRARELDLSEPVLVAYSRGKKRGSEKRRSKISLGSDAKAEEGRRDYLEGNWELQRNSSPVYVKPMVLRSPGIVKSSKLLRLPEIIRKRLDY